MSFGTSGPIAAFSEIHVHQSALRSYAFTRARHLLIFACILAAMDRKRIIAFAVAAIIAVIVSALVYEAFDIHDTKPFPIDPEFLLMMLSSSLTVCLSILLMTRPLFKLFSLMFGFVHHALRPAAFSWRNVFQDARLLFSPPLSPISLRI